MIKTTRIKSTQAPRVETLDLSGQMNGSRTTFQLPRKIHVYDRHYLVWNSTVYRNDANHRFYSVGADMQSITVYFDEPPVGGPGRTLQLAVDMSGDGDDLTVSKGEFDEAIENINNRIDTEVSDRENADEGLKSLIDEETEARENADTELNKRIDDIINSPDVRYIEGTYAELDAIDKSTVGDKDYARVLADETHEGKSTFYQFNKETQEWKYVGAADAYYTKTEADATFATKEELADIPTQDSRLSDAGARAANYFDGKVIVTSVGSSRDLLPDKMRFRVNTAKPSNDTESMYYFEIPATSELSTFAGLITAEDFKRFNDATNNSVTMEQVEEYVDSVIGELQTALDELSTGEGV